MDNDARLSAPEMGESDTSYTLLFYDIGECMMAQPFAQYQSGNSIMQVNVKKSIWVTTLHQGGTW